MAQAYYPRYSRNHDGKITDSRRAWGNTDLVAKK